MEMGWLTVALMHFSVARRARPAGMRRAVTSSARSAPPSGIGTDASFSRESPWTSHRQISWTERNVRPNPARPQKTATSATPGSLCDLPCSQSLTML